MPYTELATPATPDSIREMLDQMVVIKLNGGLGTSMGCRCRTLEIMRNYIDILTFPSPRPKSCTS